MWNRYRHRMRISSRQTHQIITGQKTQIRTLSTARYITGKSYPVNDHKGQRRCRIIVGAVDTQPLGNVDYRAARAEGHRTTDEFRAWWISEHDRAWLANHADAGHDQRMARFERRWAPKPVTVLTISLDTTERPRLLMPTGRRGGDELGYTENGAHALRDEPEAVDEFTQRWITADAHDRATGAPGRREEHLRREASQLARRLKHQICAIDIADMHVIAQLERIRTEIARLEDLRAA